MTTRSTLDRHHIKALTEARHEDPFAVLGPHPAGKEHITIRALVPDAEAITAIEPATRRELAPLTRVDDGGLFETTIADADVHLDYRLEIIWQGKSHIVDDPYRFGPLLTDYDIWLLAEGKHLRPYEQLGAHLTRVDSVAGVRFAVWAPNARRVSVVGDFNNWDGRRHPMRFRTGCGVWEIFVPGMNTGERYKYEILGATNELQPLKADPYGFASELRPANASVVVDMPPLVEPLSEKRARANQRDAPISIYEVQLGSWARGADNRFLSYAELADSLVDYVSDQGFTHIELMPVSEYPFDGSWGYQPVGLYAPTARFGTPQEFRQLVKACHDAGIGVILDWVPGHFPTDPHGLICFDGTCLYEHADPRQGFHRDWNTLIFNYGRREVCNYLFGNALYWLERFGVDGMRVDAVASMLYLDYSREGEDWIPNEYGGNENLEAIDFLRELNATIGRERPGAIMIAEESTAWPQVSQPPETGGLGFHYKWNLGWMNDTLEYMQHDPAHRRYHHNEITFSLTYAFDENFILPLSHDEVVHGKKSILGRMPGDEWQQFANLRAYYGFLFTHPGKKLLFMGDEFGQRDEWNHDQSLDWHLLQDLHHAGIARLIAALNACYADTPALHREDCDPHGFLWLDYSDHEQSVLSFIRRDSEDRHIVCFCNLTPIVRENYRVGLPVTSGTTYSELINTDAVDYGGSGVHNQKITVEPTQSHGYDASINLNLPPLATVLLAPKV